MSGEGYVPGKGYPRTKSAEQMERERVLMDEVYEESDVMAEVDRIMERIRKAIAKGAE